MFEIWRRDEGWRIRGWGLPAEKLLYPGEQIQCVLGLVVKSGVHIASFGCDEVERTVAQLTFGALIFDVCGYWNRSACDIGTRDRDDANHVAGLRCVYDFGGRDRQLHMAGAATVPGTFREDQVSGTHIAGGHRDALLHLRVRVCAEAYPGLSPGPLGEAGAVKAIGTLSAPYVRFAALTESGRGGFAARA